MFLRVIFHNGIITHLIDSISVKKGYELTVNFKINLEQFENGLEFQALSS